MWANISIARQPTESRDRRWDLPGPDGTRLGHQRPSCENLRHRRENKATETVGPQKRSAVDQAQSRTCHPESLEEAILLSQRWKVLGIRSSIRAFCDPKWDSGAKRKNMFLPYVRTALEKIKKWSPNLGSFKFSYFICKIITCCLATERLYFPFLLLKLI